MISKLCLLIGLCSCPAPEMVGVAISAHKIQDIEQGCKRKYTLAHCPTKIETRLVNGSYSHRVTCKEHKIERRIDP